MPGQWQMLEEGSFIYLEKISKKDNSGTFSSYIFLNDERDKAFFSSKNPDGFVKYGKYEMQIRDKILIEYGSVTKAKVKWHGIGTYAYPYLWKEDRSAAGYKESWCDPRLPEPQKTGQKPRLPVIPKKSRGQKR